MRKSILTLVVFLVLFSGNSIAQDFNRDFVGIYGGTVVRIDDEDQTTYMQFNFRINDEGKLICNRQFSNDEGEIYNDVKDNFTFVYQENSAVYTWINAGGIWTEIQTFMFTFNDGDLQLLHMRWVNNDTDEGNNIWGYMQRGLLEKQY